MSIAWNRRSRPPQGRRAPRVLPVARYLIGRVLSDSLHNSGSSTPPRAPCASSTSSFDDVASWRGPRVSATAALGRLAACFLDSMPPWGLPPSTTAFVYEYGIFRQEIADAPSSRCPTTGGVTGRRGWCSAPSRSSSCVPVPRADERRNNGASRFLGDTTTIVAVPTISGAGHQNRGGQHLAPVAAHASRELDISSFNRATHPRGAGKKRQRNLSRVFTPTTERAGYEPA